MTAPLTLLRLSKMLNLSKVTARDRAALLYFSKQVVAEGGDPEQVLGVILSNWREFVLFAYRQLGGVAYGVLNRGDGPSAWFIDEARICAVDFVREQKKG